MHHDCLLKNKHRFAEPGYPMLAFAIDWTLEYKTGDYSYNQQSTSRSLEKEKKRWPQWVQY
jgi:hypothetical protein